MPIGVSCLGKAAVRPHYPTRGYFAQLLLLLPFLLLATNACCLTSAFCCKTTPSGAPVSGVLFTIKKACGRVNFVIISLLWETLINSYGPVEINTELLIPAQNTNYQGI